ncbi:hypothetical protein ACFOOM_03205 [Streptomyces echinoruber]|uniref:Large membrane protein n=1 Tax=Streptomyces echinoruber TaxID=68898 RepID=A0A918V6H1_9ACTN|nr:hypothetical protein [Streptomyces echinoruber]GGZ69921.1 hypothetical protein GCM10010389_04170 [Streptomyces echinoruber]
MNAERPDKDDEVRAGAEPGAGTEPEVGGGAEVGTEPGAAGEAGAGTEPGAAGEAEPDAGIGAEVGAAEADAEAGAESGAEPDAEAGAEVGAGAGQSAGGTAKEPGAADGTPGSEGGSGSGAGNEGGDGTGGENGDGTGSEDGDGDVVRTGRRRTPLVVASVAAAVLLVGGGGAYLAATASGEGRPVPGAASGDTTPPPLALDGWSAPSASAPDGASGGTSNGTSNGIAPGEPNPYGPTYRAAGPLPEGPGKAPVYLARGEVTRAQVARLAEALGVEGTPVAQGTVWRVGVKDGSGPTLRVERQAPGTWTFSRYAPGTDDCKKTAPACTHDPAAPTVRAVGEAAARKAAAPVLEALGQDGARVDASRVMGAQRVVDADPVVGGLPTHGWTTGLTVDARGEVVGGSGRLVAPVKGDTYPVLDARRTLDEMNRVPRGDHRMGIGGCASPVPLKDRFETPCGSGGTPDGAGGTPDGAGGTPARQEATVEHAVFGLAARSVRGRPALVPSWLFTVRTPDTRDAATVTYPAIDPAYLTSAASATPSPRPDDGTGGTGGTPATRDVKVTGYTAEGSDLTVAFQGGVCSDYRVTARESARKVTVTVTERSRPGRVCILIAKLYHRTVHLDRPLGDRQVVGSDGKVVPREKADTRPPAASSPTR